VLVALRVTAQDRVDLEAVKVILTGKEHSDMIHLSVKDNLYTVSEGIYPLLSVGTDLLDDLLSLLKAGG